MGRWINGFLDNESTFGRLMGRIAVMIGANLIFVLFCLPVITIGPAFVSLFYVMLETLHKDDVVNPFRTFWKSFKMNLRQGILCTLLFVAAAGLLVLDIRFCTYAGGVLLYFKYGCYALLVLLIIEAVYLMPVMAAFEDTIPHLLRTAFFFAFRRPHKMLLAVALFVVPALVTVLDTRYRPLYGFLWTVIGFGLISMMISELLYRDIEQYLPKEEEFSEEGTVEEGSGKNLPAKSQRQILREMKKLDR